MSAHLYGVTRRKIGGSNGGNVGGYSNELQGKKFEEQRYKKKLGGSFVFYFWVVCVVNLLR